MDAAGAVLLGGHTVKDSELKYGLSVNGLVHPERITRNHTVEEGDHLYLTKPLGTGLLMTMERKGELADGLWAKALAGMVELNKLACELMLQHGAHAATDVTGFGLLGHLFEMCSPGGYTAELDLASLPLYDGVLDAAQRLGLSGPMRRNLERPAEYFGLKHLPDWQLALLADPQTSGGLLVALDVASGKAFEKAMHASGEVVKCIGMIRKHR